ncbi:hypothetical protein [Paenibacillus sp. 2TAB19]|uniref:hypothetical protein n=1 Tax=Paenibacillus sp. 2TAB19 TaxID=3233003 RepID=UPI003F9C28EC
MPPYFSVYYSFPHSSFSEEFVEEVYKSFFHYFPYKSGYWEAEDNSLEEIIRWNTNLLGKKFRLGFNQHVKNNYKQVLLDSELHDHLRLFWSCDSKEITLHMITPERDVVLDDNTWRLNGNQIKSFINLSVGVWETHITNNIQTYHELDAPIPINRILKGEHPATDPFCIIGSKTFMKIKDQIESRYFLKTIKDGVLILDKIYASLLEEDR